MGICDVQIQFSNLKLSTRFAEQKLGFLFNKLGFHVKQIQKKENPFLFLEGKSNLATTAKFEHF